MKRNTLCTLFLGLLLVVSGLHAQAPAAGKSPAPAKSGKAETKADAKTAPPAAGDKMAAKAAVPAGAQIDINRASADELKTLPGIGDAYSAAIIKNRPYKNKTQLTARKVIPDAAYEKIRDRIIAKQ